MSILDGFISCKFYDKHDDFDFEIVNFPYLDGDVPRRASYGVYVSQLIQFAGVSSHVTDFKKGKRKVQAVPQSQTAALPRHQEEEEEEIDKSTKISVFFSPFSIAITSLVKEGANLNALRTFFSICACLVLSVSSSSSCLGRAAVCNCGTPWTFLLPFLLFLSFYVFACMSW